MFELCEEVRLLGRLVGRFAGLGPEKNRGIVLDADGLSSGCCDTAASGIGLAAVGLTYE